MGRTVEIIVPAMGEGVMEATLVQWLKAEGAKVLAGEALLEIQTDKVNNEVHAPADGILVQHLAQAGQIVKVHGLLAKFEITGKVPESQLKIPLPMQSQSPDLQESPKNPATTSAKAFVKASPLARKLAAEAQIEISQIKGSGIGGKILSRDLSRPVKANSSASPKEKGTIRREPMSAMRRLIADHMLESVRVSPHVTTVFEIDMKAVDLHRQAHKETYLRQFGQKLTYTSYILEATAQALKAFPVMNASVEGYDILYRDDIHLGVAVAIEQGLVVPVIRCAEQLNLLGITQALNDLVNRARQKKLSADDLKGGTFTVTNPGGFGSLSSNPIINQPQVGILGVGSIVKRPVVIEGDAIQIRPQMLLSITFDHRLIDGETGARFLAHIKSSLESYS